MRVFVIVVCAFVTCHEVLAASLRANNVSRNNSSFQALDAVMSMVDGMKADREPLSKMVNENASHRAKLDLGFTGYEQGLTEAMTVSIRKMTQDKVWTEPMRQRLIANVTATVVTSINDQVKPVKKSIGKTWMALPADDQKNVYASELKLRFESVFSEAVNTTMTFFERGAFRVKNLGKRSLPGDDLLQQSEQALARSVLADRCYGSMLEIRSELKNATQDMKAVFTVVIDPENQTRRSNATLAGDASHSKSQKFCMANMVSNLVTRLNDAQGLLSMSMRFEAGAMDLVQTQTRR